MPPRTDDLHGLVAAIRRLAAFCLVLSILATPLAFASSGNQQPGNPVRRAILDALRQRMQGLLGTDLVFVVKSLKVKDGWSWIHVLPRSADGQNRYEDIFALVRRQKGIWIVAELACTEDDNPQCLGNPDFFSELKKRFPKLPEEILPKR